MKLVSGILAAATLATTALLTDCGMPGATLGIYTVNGTVQTNTCGGGLGAPSPWKFNVELSRAASDLYWNTMDGAPLLVGTVSGKSVSFDDEEAGSADSAPDGAPGPCTMQRGETLSLGLDSAAAPKSFSGTLTYTFAVATGSDCADQMSAQGGMYDALPCTLTYAVQGAYSHTD